MKKLLLASLMLGSVASYAQTKKVLLEDFTGINCCWCPDGTAVADYLKKTEPVNFIPLAIHTSTLYTPANSPLRTPEGDAINAMAKPAGYPNGAVDRKKYNGASNVSMSRGLWKSAYNARKALPALVSVGMANRTVSGTTYSMDVNIKFTTLPTSGVPLKVQVYLVEDSIVATGALAQKNCGDSMTGTPVPNFHHNNVLRKALGGTWGYGDIIPSTGPVKDVTYTKNVTFTLTTGASPVGWVKKNMKVYAFVAYDGPESNDQKEIINVEEVTLNGFYPLGVNDIDRNISVLNAFPNPATVSDLVKVEYNINESSNVTMKVINTLGQIVAQPYNSFEVEGAHTIHWRPSETGVTPGMYIIQLSTPNGMTSQMITVK